MALTEQIKRIAAHELGRRLDRVDGHEAHRILPEIWPIINELRALTDACEQGRVSVAE
mgnify:CR=1 FL=1